MIERGVSPSHLRGARVRGKMSDMDAFNHVITKLEDLRAIIAAPPPGGRAVPAIGVAVEQVLLHCAKAFLRSRLWTPGQWPARDVLPSYACMVFEQVRPLDATADDYQREIAEDNATKLY